MKKKLAFAVGVGLMVVAASFAPVFNSPAQAAESCSGIVVVWTPQELPSNTRPVFTISGPGGLSLQASDSNSNTLGSIYIYSKNGASLPVGNYTINPAATTGTSQLKTVNGVSRNAATLFCGDQNSLIYVLTYQPSAPTGSGPSLRITPTAPTVKVGEIVFLDAEYSINGSTNWQKVGTAATFSSPQDPQNVTSLGSPHGSGAEFRGNAVGTAQINATYAGLTATTNLTVTAGTYAPPVVIAAGTCEGIVIESSLPTNWTLTGPGGVSIKSPNYPQMTPGFTVTKDNTGGTLPSGSYTISVPATVPGGQNPVITTNFGGGGALGSITSGSFECPRNSWPRVGIRYEATNPPLAYQKTLIDMPYDGSQMIPTGAFLNGHFVFRGANCAIGMNGPASFKSGGSGLWSISENGSKIQERQICLDGGSASNITYHHSINDGYMGVIDDKNFVFTNSTWAACVSGMQGDGTCSVNGPGASKDVYYTFEGDQVVIKNVTDPQLDATTIPGLTNFRTGDVATSGGYTLKITPSDVLGASLVVTKGGQQVQRLFLPGGGRPTVVLASPGGYVAIGSLGSSDPMRARIYLYKLGGVSQTPDICTTNPFDPSCNPTGPGGPLPQTPGQTFNITYSSTTSTAPPEVLIRLANIVSVGAASMNINIFGMDYAVDASRAQIVNMSWAPTSISNFVPGGLVNVWGTLDLANANLIHAARVRSPIPFGTPVTAQSSAAIVPATTVAAPVSSDLQNRLNTLQEALKALQLQLGQ